jgi:hypothetical protein
VGGGDAESVAAGLTTCLDRGELGAPTARPAPEEVVMKAAIELRCDGGRNARELSRFFAATLGRTHQRGRALVAAEGDRERIVGGRVKR